MITQKIFKENFGVKKEKCSMKKPAKLSSLSRNQELILRAIRIAQQTIKLATLGKIKPHWVLPLAGHFCTRNQQEENSKSGDSEPGLPSHRWYKEKQMILSRYKRRALVPILN